jgi:uncharacterized membrane protein YhhN
MSNGLRTALRVVAVATGVVAAVAHLVGEARGSDLLAIAAKPIPVALLAAAVFLAGASKLRLPVGTGLAVSAVADVLIQRPGGFLSGLAAFLVAHLVYTFGFWRARPELLSVRAIPVLVFSGSMAALVVPRLVEAGGSLAPAVVLYILAISAMLWRAAALPGAPGLATEVGPVAIWGAALFAASDSLIAIHRFVTPLSWANLPIMLLYWAGQAGIAAAAIFAGREGRR